MRNLILAAAAVTLAVPATAADGGVIIAAPGVPFLAGHKDIVRVIPEPNAAALQPHLSGPAKLVTYAVRRSNDLVTTPSHIEYDIVPTGKGKVTLELVFPSPGVKTRVAVVRYDFEVK